MTTKKQNEIKETKMTTKSQKYYKQNTKGLKRHTT